MVLNSVIIPNSNYNKAIALMNEGKYSEAIVAFEEFEGYKDSIEQIVNCENGIIENKYQSAIVLMEANKYQEAIEAFEELDGYKDSAGKANSCNLKSANIGDYVFFGTYEQDNNNSNGKEDIEWLVLEKKEGKK